MSLLSRYYERRGLAGSAFFGRGPEKAEDEAKSPGGAVQDLEAQGGDREPEGDPPAREAKEGQIESEAKPEGQGGSFEQGEAPGRAQEAGRRQEEPERAPRGPRPRGRAR